MRFASAPSAVWTIIDGARSWRIARDAGDPVQPSLYRRLETLGAGLIAPVLDSVMTVFEAGFRRRFRAGDRADSAFTSDERQLLELLEDGNSSSAIERFNPDLTSTMRIALRSMRIMMRSVTGEESGISAEAAARPIFFVTTATRSLPSPHAMSVG